MITAGQMNAKMLEVKTALDAYIVWIEYYGDGSWALLYINRENAQIRHKLVSGHELAVDFMRRCDWLITEVQDRGKEELESLEVS